VPGVLVDTDAWTRDALALLCALPGVARVGLALTEGGGRRHLFTASDRSGLDWCHVDAYEDVPLNTVVRTGSALAGTLDELADRYPVFVDRQRGTPYVAVAAAPIVAAGQVLGGFVLFLDEPADLGPLEEVGRLLGEGLRRAQGSEHRVRPSLADEPLPSGARVAVHRVGPELVEAAAARRFLTGTLAGWGLDEDTVFSAELCLSELVTNALIHTRGGAEVRLVLDRGVLTTTVRDGGVGGLAMPADDPLRVHGHGLQLVDAIATRWGSRLDKVGTTVWFDLET
jgi:hypothetical protein